MSTSRRLLSVCCVPLFLGACSQPPPKTEYTASPEIVAVFSGQARGADFSLARACGADAGATRARAAGDPVPATLSAEAGAIYKTALVARAAETVEKPSADLCGKLRERTDLAGLFPGGRPPEPARPAQPTAAYCAEGSEAVRRDPTMSTGLQAIRAKCRRGDTIALPADAIGIIASVCDLSKPTPASGANVFCTVGPVRRMRGG